MFQQKTFKTYFFLFIALWLLWALMMSPVAFAVEGAVEFPVIKSKALADAGIDPSEQELGVYLPPEYATSGLAYPVMYLFHGAGGTDRSYFLSYNVVAIAESLVAQGKMSPMILVGPNMPVQLYATSGNPWADYFLQDIMPFVERTYRTLRAREHRGIAGYSKGGSDVIQLTFMRPDLFSVMGANAAAQWLTMEQLEELAKNYDAAKYPIRFWIYHGRNDTLVPFANSERFIAFVKGKGWEYVFEVGEGDHFSLIPLGICLQYFSKSLGAPLTAVQPQGKLATTWAEMKRR